MIRSVLTSAGQRPPPASVSGDGTAGDRAHTAVTAGDSDATAAALVFRSSAAARLSALDLLRLLAESWAGLCLATDAILGWAGLGTYCRLVNLPWPAVVVNPGSQRCPRSRPGESYRCLPELQASLLVAFRHRRGSLAFPGAGPGPPVLVRAMGHFASPYAHDGGISVPASAAVRHVEAIASGPVRSVRLRLRLGGAHSGRDARAALPCCQGRRHSKRAARPGSAAAGQAVGGLANILTPRSWFPADWRRRGPGGSLREAGARKR